MLSENQREKYSRQLWMREIGDDDMVNLIHSTVLVIGAGGLGSPVLLYLTAAGIGKIGIVEHDIVALHNLQRQILYSYDDIGKKKIRKASERLKQLNPETKIIEYSTWWDEALSETFTDKYQVIVDCTDNLNSRIISDSFARNNKIPFVYGAIDGWEGQVTVFEGNRAKDYSEIFGLEKNRVFENTKNGVLGVTASVIGGIMASEVIKILLSKGQILSGKLLHVNLFNNQYNLFNL